MADAQTEGAGHVSAVVSMVRKGVDERNLT